MRNPLRHKTETEHTETLCELGLFWGIAMQELIWCYRNRRKKKKQRNACSYNHFVLYLVRAPMQSRAGAVWRHAQPAGTPRADVLPMSRHDNTPLRGHLLPKHAAGPASPPLAGLRKAGKICPSQSSNSCVPIELLQLRSERAAVQFPQRMIRTNISQRLKFSSSLVLKIKHSNWELCTAFQ